MDKLLELLGQYKCHLRRDDQSTADLLEENFQQYVNDLSTSINPSDNPVVGSNMCEMIYDKLADIEQNAKDLVQVLRLYCNGNIRDASNLAFLVFSKMKPQLMQRYSGATITETYFRIRKIEDTPFPLIRKELFHIPKSKNHLIGAERYSTAGYPCLYLASQPELAWYECNCPKKFAIAKFFIPQEPSHFLRFIDFSEKLVTLSHSFHTWFINETEKLEVQRYLLKHIYSYPLRAACSVSTKYPNAQFHEEYIVPQLLLNWVRNNAEFDGIRYESSSNNENVCYAGAHNLVLVTKTFDSDGYDEKLRGCIKLTLPKAYDISNFSGNDPYLWPLRPEENDYNYI